MADEFRKIIPNQAVTPKETREISPLSSPLKLEPEVVGDDLSSRRPYINDCLNSRLARALPGGGGKWKVRCNRQLEPGTRPKHILHGADRVIIQGDGPWQLFDSDCQPLSKGYLPTSDVVLDAENKLFYLTDSAGMIEARNLADGAKAFSVSLFFGNAYYRSFIARKNGRMIVVSTEREIDQDAVEKPDKSIVEVLEFFEPAKIDADGRLTSARITSELIRKTLTLLAAAQDKTLVAATHNQICLLDFDLQIPTALNGEFEPVVFSLSGGNIIYIVVSDKGVLKLRSVTFDGERLYSTELPEDITNIFYPPIVGYDHRIYLVADNRLIVYGIRGRCLWEFKARNRIGGAAVTTDNELLITAGPELGMFDADGLYKTLYEFEGESLQTPPALNAAGELLVASDRNLYCLTAVDES